MRSITPHLWFEDRALEAAERYCALFPGSSVDAVVTLPGTPAGDTELVYFTLFGQRFVAIGAGPTFQFSPGVSLSVACADADEVDRYWDALASDGEVLMPLGSYPFSARYGWTSDRYGVSWQISVADGDLGQRITPSLLFVGDVAGQTGRALEHYTSVLPDAGVDLRVPYGEAADGGDTADHVMYASFRLAGQQFSAMDSSHPDHDFGLGGAISFVIECEDQDELDRYTDALSADPDRERCGWLVDRFGLLWQVGPVELDRMLIEGSPRQLAAVTETMVPMRRLDLAALRRSYEDAADG